MRIFLYLYVCALAVSALPAKIKQLQLALGSLNIDYLFTLQEPYDLKATFNYSIEQDDSLALPIYFNYTLITYQDDKPQVHNGSFYDPDMMFDYNDYNTDDEECWATGTGVFTASGRGEDEGGNYYGYLATSCEHGGSLPNYNVTSEFSGVYRDGYTQGKGLQTRNASYPGESFGEFNRSYLSSISYQFEGFLNHTGIFKNVSGHSIFTEYTNTSSYGEAYNFTGNGYYDPASWTLTTTVTATQINDGKGDVNSTFSGIETTGLYPQVNSGLVFSETNTFCYPLFTFNKYIRQLRSLSA